jgi:cytochrome c556
MKRVLSIACLLFSFALTVSLSAQTTPPAGSAPTAGMKIATDADYAVNIHSYWAAKKVDDATTASQNIVTSLQAVQKALAANDMAAAETARAAIGANCMSCHTAHREKLPEGGFRIK